MNLKNIYSRGSKYVNAAGNNWSKRRDKMIHLWASAPYTNWSGDTIRYDNYHLRLQHIILELDSRLTELCKIVYEQREIDRVKSIEAAHIWVELECENWECRFAPDALGISILYKNYDEHETVKYLCNKCGQQLKVKGYEQIREQLLRMGITTGIDK